ncbi:hypothetical protein KQX54_019366 [Cotesia glomerata]|uniref:Uncharacterized protein n=1 Tax=Cotesia glomerata TaxID=32391 RepID=A0AAV7I4K7_COTGL|nr:hypothetical protein KQX54_019366 [Cotesia glomerata]
MKRDAKCGSSLTLRLLRNGQAVKNPGAGVGLLGALISTSGSSSFAVCFWIWFDTAVMAKTVGCTMGQKTREALHIKVPEVMVRGMANSQHPAQTDNHLNEILCNR